MDESRTGLPEIEKSPSQFIVEMIREAGDTKYVNFLYSKVLAVSADCGLAAQALAASGIDPKGEPDSLQSALERERLMLGDIINERTKHISDADITEYNRIRDEAFLGSGDLVYGDIEFVRAFLSKVGEVYNAMQQEPYKYSEAELQA